MEALFIFGALAVFIAGFILLRLSRRKSNSVVSGGGSSAGKPNDQENAQQTT